ncbi:MAG: transglycosylase SLT domain-containing protein [Deltaproteobacteria bacterium]|nr:transglycosylase SLT domain-containing protein [Deltaproteobacteria bacterium]
MNRQTWAGGLAVLLALLWAGEGRTAEPRPVLPESPVFLQSWTQALRTYLDRYAEGYVMTARVETGNSMDLYENQKVRRYLALYANNWRPMFQQGLDRAGKYLPMMRRVMAEEGLPQELAYLAIVESNLDPAARSQREALGLWQFRAVTAREFGLRVEEPWYDERLDPELSTHAAARLLKHLHARYGSWELALAAYNAGEGRVNKALRQSQARGKSQDFWGLPLPNETRSYVPMFMAIVLVYQDLETHGFSQPEEELQPRLDLLRGPYLTTLSDAAQRAGVPTEEMARLNPAWRLGWLPPRAMAGRKVALRFPLGMGQRFQASVAEAPLEDQWPIHRVRRGDTLVKVARQEKVSLQDLAGFNGLKPRSALRAGQELLIPLSGEEMETRRLAQERTLAGR